MYIVDTRPRAKHREAFDLGNLRQWRYSTEGGGSLVFKTVNGWEHDSSNRFRIWKDGRHASELYLFGSDTPVNLVTGWHEDVADRSHEASASGPAMVCMGQVWEVRGLGRVLVLHTRLEKDELEVIVSASRMRTIIPTRDLVERAEFVSGPVTIEEELLFVAEEEMRSVPEGMIDERWKSLVTGVKECFFREHHDEAPYQFREALALLRWSVPYFRRARGEGWGP